MPPRTVCVFAGTREGADAAYVREASALGHLLAESGIQMIYGGGGSGMMGAVSDAAVLAGGRVTGVLAPGFEMEVTDNPGVTIRTEPNVAYRKRYMCERSDAFVALPGGYGTVDEVFEIIITQLAREHAKPLVLIDTNGFWSDFERLCKGFERQGFADDKVLASVTRLPRVELLHDALGIALPARAGAQTASA